MNRTQEIHVTERRYKGHQQVSCSEVCEPPQVWNLPGEGAPNAQTRDQPGETGVEGEGGQKEAAPNHGKQACSDGQDQQVLSL